MNTLKENVMVGKYKMNTHDKLLILFKKMASCNSVDNELPSVIYFYSLLGAYFKNTKISWGITNKDVRIHTTWLQASRSGKDQLNKVLSIVGSEIGLDVVTQTDLSGDAALLGTYDSDAHKYNVQNGLTPENPIKTKKDGVDLIYKDPIIKGDMANYDIVIISEGKLLFQTGSEKLLTILQPALDHPGKVRKKMKNTIPVEYVCDATLVTTSIPFKELNKSIVDQGFFQRTILYIRRLSVDDVLLMRQKAKELRLPKYQKEFQNMLQEFKQVVNSYDREQHQIVVGEEASNTLIKFQKKFINMIRERIVGPEVMNALSFTQTAEDLALKIGAISCILDKRKEITAADINTATYPVTRFLETIVEELDVSLDSQASEALTTIHRLVISQFTKMNLQSMPTTMLAKLVATEKNIGFNKARSMINELVTMNYLEQKQGEKNSHQICVKGGRK